MKKRFSTGQKVLTVILSLLLILILSGVGYLTYLSSKVTRVEIDRSEVTNTGKEIAKEDVDVITVALFGTDYQGAEFGSADSTMILSINTKTNEIKLMSLMRDIYLDLPTGEKCNLNYTMANGGPSLILKTINYNFNLNVDKFVQVDLTNLPIVIDTLGGVELTITDEELNYINGIIPDINKENKTTTENLYGSGKQTLNGTQAAAYCRIRSTAGRDYKRTERQRDVLESLFNKASTLSVADLPALVSDLLPLVTTNLTNGEILSIAPKVLSMGITDIEQARFPLDEHHTMEFTDMYHMMVDIEKTTEEIHKFIYSK